MDLGGGIGRQRHDAVRHRSPAFLCRLDRRAPQHAQHLMGRIAWHAFDDLGNPGLPQSAGSGLGPARGWLLQGPKSAALRPPSQEVGPLQGPLPEQGPGRSFLFRWQRQPARACILSQSRRWTGNEPDPEHQGCRPRPDPAGLCPRRRALVSAGPRQPQKRNGRRPCRFNPCPPGGPRQGRRGPGYACKPLRRRQGHLLTLATGRFAAPAEAHPLRRQGRGATQALDLEGTGRGS